MGKPTQSWKLVEYTTYKANGDFKKAIRKQSIRSCHIAASTAPLPSVYHFGNLWHLDLGANVRSAFVAGYPTKLIFNEIHSCSEISILESNPL